MRTGRLIIAHSGSLRFSKRIFELLQGNAVAGQGSVVEPTGSGTSGGGAGKCEPASAENALDTLLDELQTTSTVTAATAVTAVAAPTVTAVAAPAGTAVAASVVPPAIPSAPKPVLRRLSSTSSVAAEAGGKPPVPERTPDLQNKRMPPPPPPRTSSKSPVASPTACTTAATTSSSSSPRGSISDSPPGRRGSLTGPTSSGVGKPAMPEPGSGGGPTRQEQLEQRHQELLKKQKALQEQYMRLQQLQRCQPPPDLLQLKKTGSEGNLLVKMGLSMSAAAPISGSLTQLAAQSSSANDASAAGDQQKTVAAAAASTTTTVNKVYETDII